MTEQQINQTIAEACGWDMDPKDAHEWQPRGGWVKSPRGTMKFRHAIPDYCNDLNAMHEAEKVLVYKPESVIGRSTLAEYENQLYEICGDFRCAITATARQRAEAFLRTIGKWEEQS